MSKQVNLYEAKTNLSRLVEEAAKGNEIVIAKNGVPLARLVSATSKPKKRRLGASNHRFVEIVSREIADAEIAKEFEDSEIWPNT
jgi:prevent-host-death family protein